MVILGYITIFFWIVQFYFKRHYMLAGTLVTVTVFGLYYRITEGTWEMLMFWVITILVIYNLYHLARFAMAVLDVGINRMIEARLYHYKYTIKELIDYIAMKLEKTEK